MTSTAQSGRYPKQRLPQDGGKIAAVVNHVVKRVLAKVIGHFFMANQIPPSHLGRIEIQSVCDHIQ